MTKVGLKTRPRIPCKLVGLALAVAGGGCSVPPVPPPANSATPLAEVAPSPPAAPRPVAPTSTPVYRNPTIGVVYLRAHQDAEGRLLGPQIIYQVVDPGGWNLEAVESGHGSVSASNRELPPENASLPGDPSPLDPARAVGITITGLVRRQDRPEAEAMAMRIGGGNEAVFDTQAGWLLVPPEPARPAASDESKLVQKPRPAPDPNAGSHSPDN